MRVTKMDEETKYRVEDPNQVDDDLPGIMKPLPQAPESRRDRRKRSRPMVKFLGVTMKETSRDNLLFIMVPLLVGLIDANIYSWIIVGLLEESTIYMLIIPLFAAILVGLLMPNARKALGGAILASFFFAMFLMVFLVSPGFYSQSGSIGEFFMSAAVITAVYVFLVVLSSLLGSIIGMLLREFF